MPAAIALILRSAVQFAITLGVLEAADWVLIPALKKAVQWYMVNNGYTEEQAKDSVANDVIEIAATLGVGIATLRTKLPTKAAEYLGFTSKGWAKRGVFAAVVTKTAPVAVVAPKLGVLPIIGAKTAAEETVAKAIVTKGGFKYFHDTALKYLGIGLLAAMVVGNWIDFGNWGQGAYQGTFQRIFAKVSGGLLVPDADYRESLTVSSEVFDKVFNTYKLEGATHINDPFKGQTVEFTRDNLLDLTDKVGAKLLNTKGKAGTADVLFATQTMIVFTGISGGGSLGYVGNAQVGLSTGTGSTTTTPKIFTGIVSQGVIGRGLEFIPRQDDLIESLTELQTAAANNLTPFLQSLLGKIVYEVKIVPSVITKDGFKQSGTVQQVRSGTNKDGSPKYKTVVNKFAQLTLYIMTDKGVRSKITTITLGPTDSTKFFVGPNEIRSIEAAIPGLVFTKDINEITGIETINSVTVSTPATAGGTPTPEQQTGSVVTSATPVSTQAPGATVPGLNALTLFDWFAARGQEVPPMSERAIVYEAAELGNMKYYTGTSEQNTKLLAWYKKRALESEVDRLQKLQKERTAAQTKESASAKSSTKATQEKESASAKSSSKVAEPKKVTRIYTTTGGERVTKYSDGSETRAKVK